MKTEGIKNGITKMIQDRRRAEDAKNENSSGAAREKLPDDGTDLPGSLSNEQVFDLAGGGRPGNPDPPH